MKPNEADTWIAENHFRASVAMSALIAGKKQRVSEYDERLRKLKGFTQELVIKSQIGQAELFDPKDVLSPELAKLIENPLRGLD